jgi:hypothetical protein
VAIRKEVRVGDEVRSYDFPGFSTTEYVEGVVEKVGYSPLGRDCERYHVRVKRQVVRGLEVEDSPLIGQLVYPPVNGTPSWLGGKTSGVERILRRKEKAS